MGADYLAGSRAASRLVLVESLPILVVDDEATIRSLVAEMLEDEGYAVLSATNGEEALDVLAEHRVGAILLDLRMPVMDGRTFANALRARGFRVPIVVMTAERGGQSVANEIDAVAHLTKPFDIDELYAILARLNHRPPSV